MAVTVRCQHCGQRYSVREDLLGKQIKCKACSQVMAIIAEPAVAKAAPPKPAGAKPATQPAAAAKPPAARLAPAAAKSAGAAAAPAKQRTPGGATNPARARPAAGGVQQTGAPKPPAAAVAPTAAPPANDPLFGPSSNFLDLLNDASLPAPGAAPLGSGVVLKGSNAAPLAKPKTKKKKKKKSSGGASIQTQTAMRMLGGAFVVLLGLGAFGMAIVKLTSDDDSGFHVWRAIRWSMLGVSLVGSGLKLIVG